ncbi:MAG TPA: phenylalanine--tRNA ligase subunit beta [Verrucomicrobiota bacterium]|nr:phenylalanine--tRNA ligase subunit beta [Verrucomicrobiota bacterium]HNT14738.1 phenylalanine--tRNA ligase subunit beta [Verrucomicrobiota bacterium]
MKVTLNWLKQYVDFNWSVETTVEQLTMLGLEVEGVQKLAGAFHGIVVAQVLTRDKHPNADKLSLCRVNDGTTERQIVCGAQNFQAGDKVPLILPGASLPLQPGEKTPHIIKVGKIRGVESQGMMCSPRELGLSDEADGLLILRPDAPVGQSFDAYLGRSSGDVVFDLEVTPNRPDLNSVIGIAREIAARAGVPLQLPALPWPPPAPPAAETAAAALVAVHVAAPELCPRYTARVIQGVTIGPSPDWLKNTLEKVGLRSINNVVDVTNFVMLETGQPLHAFDYHLIAKGGDGQPMILVRRAGPAEKFRTLDGQEHTLQDTMLLIADPQKGIALAGIMGGANTEINPQTVDVLLESAYFAPTQIRRTSKQLGLRSESSYRFERGADEAMCDWASRRAAQLILETAGGRLAAGVVEARASIPPAPAVTLRFARTNALLGISIPATQQTALLGRLGFTALKQTDDSVTVATPSWRVDIKHETDLIEEIERLHGLEKTAATAPRGAIGTNAFDAVYDQLAEVRRILTAAGLDEAQGQTLIGRAEVRDIPPAAIVALTNPLSADMDVLRPGLLPGLLHSLRHNVTRKNYDVRLFEIGRVFFRRDGRAHEERRVAIALTGRRTPHFWSGAERDATLDAADLKGIVTELLEQLGLRGAVYARRETATDFFLESATITLGGRLPLGELGVLSPILARKYDLRDVVLLAELNLDQLLARRNPVKSFKPLPPYPASRRDVAMFVPETVTHDEVLQTVRGAKAPHLESVELFDVFRGKNVPAGRKSLAYALTYRGRDRTLTEVEVNTAHETVLAALKTNLSAELR